MHRLKNLYLNNSSGLRWDSPFFLSSSILIIFHFPTMHISFTHAYSFFLILVLGMGGAVKGSQRWFSIGSFSVQPSEFMKITLVLTLARFLRYKKYGIGLFDIGGFSLFNIHTNGAYCEAARPWYGAGSGSYLTFNFIYCWYPAAPPVYAHRCGSGYITFSLDVYVEVLSKDEDYWISLAGEGHGLGAGYHRLQSLIAVGSGGLFGTDGETAHKIR